VDWGSGANAIQFKAISTSLSLSQPFSKRQKVISWSAPLVRLDLTMVVLSSCLSKDSLQPQLGSFALKFESLHFRQLIKKRFDPGSHTSYFFRLLLRQISTFQGVRCDIEQAGQLVALQGDVHRAVATGLTIVKLDQFHVAIDRPPI